jgi:dipeptidase
VAFTAWTFIAQSRAWLPPPIAALLWFAPDDSSTAVRAPFYGGITRLVWRPLRTFWRPF